MSESVSGWMRANLGLAVTLMALVGTIVGGIVAATAWLASVHHLERRVDVLRAEVNVIRATMEDNRKTVGEVRRGLDATDAALKEGLARLDERLKGAERNH